MIDGSITAKLERALAPRAPLLAHGGCNALRLVNGEGDQLPGLYLDQLADLLYLHAEPGAPVEALIEAWNVVRPPLWQPRAIYRKWLQRNLRARNPKQQLPERIFEQRCEANTKGAAGSSVDGVLVREGDLRFLVRPAEGYSHGLFLDQRENRVQVRARLAARPRSDQPCTALNTFAYTCSFSVAAAKAGAAVTSVDLSAHYLEWGRQNFVANDLDPAAHDFARGDALTYLAIAAKKGRHFDLVILDPPTFATSKQRGVFQVERHYGDLFALALRVTAPGGSLLCSHNQRTFTRGALQQKLRDTARTVGRSLTELSPFSPPLDFPGVDPVNPASRGFWVTVA